MAISPEDEAWLSILNAIYAMNEKNVLKWAKDWTKEGSPFTATLELKIYEEGRFTK